MDPSDINCRDYCRARKKETKHKETGLTKLWLLLLSVAPLTYAQTNTFCAGNLPCIISTGWTFQGANTHSGVEIFTGAVQIKSANSTVYVSIGNPQGWAGANACAWINSAIASLPTLNGFPVGVVDLRGLASNSLVLCGTTVVATGSRLKIIGPGAGALRFNCTMNGDCFNTQEGAGFSPDPGFYIGGFSLEGPGALANAVGIHAGDMVGGTFEDIDIDNFTGTNGACLLLDNQNGFFERNTFNRMQLGLLTGVNQAGCTSLLKASQPSSAFKSSYSHNHFFNMNHSVAAGQTAFNFGGGYIFDTYIAGTGNVVSGNTATVLAISGFTYTGSGVNTLLDGVFFISTECTLPCTGGTLLNIPAGYSLTERSGSYFHDASHTLSVGPIAGSLSRIINDETTSQVEHMWLMSHGSNYSVQRYLWQIAPPAVARVLTINDPGTAANFAWAGNGSTNVGAFGLAEQTAPSGLASSDVCYGDSTAHAIKCSYNNGTFYSTPQVIARGTSTMTSGSIGAATCAVVVTSTATGAATTDAIQWAYATAPTLTTDALLHISPYVTTNNVNFTRCNPTGEAIVGTAIVINWSVIR